MLLVAGTFRCVEETSGPESLIYDVIYRSVKHSFNQKLHISLELLVHYAIDEYFMLVTERVREMFIKIVRCLATLNILTLTDEGAFCADVDDQRWRVQPITPNVEVTSHSGLIFNHLLDLSLQTWSQSRAI
jgi:hypothetical protein